MISKRIEWCDVYKGILILLVVVGHSTGMFNKYIYQFHMAAFFFISGYMSNLETKSFYDLFLDKFFKLMVPFYFLGIIGNTLFYMLRKIGVLDKISTTVYPNNLQDAMINLFSKGMISCDWLGALWFLPVLFLTYVVVKLILNFTKGNRKYAFVISVIIFIISERLIISANSMRVLSGIAQFYFVMGLNLKNVKIDYKRTKKTDIYLIIVTLIITFAWYSCSNIFIKNVVDWPTGRFNGPVVDALLPIFGIITTYMISKLIAKQNIASKIFQYLGKNTMGIMSFHFVGFKIAYILLGIFSCIEWENLKLLTPTVNDGNRYWPIITIVSVIFSLLIWSLINRVYICRIFLNGHILDLTGNFEKNIEKCYMFMKETFGEMGRNISKKIRRFSIIFLFIILAFWSCRHIESIAGNMEKIHVTFPYYYDNISFDNGWLEQGEFENYRCVEQSSEISLFLADQHNMHIEGFIPDNVQNMTCIKVYVNNNIAYEADIRGGQQLFCNIPISSCTRKYATNKIKIVFDGIRIPNEQDEDKRVFSALISTMIIQ